MNLLMTTDCWPCPGTPAGSWISAPWTKFILLVCASMWHPLPHLKQTLKSLLSLDALTSLPCLNFRSIIEKPFYRYHDLQAGQVVEVRAKHRLTAKLVVE